MFLKGLGKMEYTLNYSFTCHLTENKNLFISVAGTSEIEYINDVDFYLNVIDLLKHGIPIKEFKTNLEKNGFLVEQDDLNDLINFWLEKNIIKPREDDLDNLIRKKKYEKYDRQIKNFATLPNMTGMDGIEFQDKFDDSTIAIIGAGGVGSYVLYGLAAMGFGKLKIVEGDIIELSNTSRQILYSEKEIGKKKAYVAQNKLSEIGSNITVEVLDIFLTSSTLEEVCDFIDGSDFIIQCADTPRDSIEYLVDDISGRLNIPWLTFAPFGFSKIFLGPLIVPGKTKSLKELIPNISLNNNEQISELNQNFTPTIMDPYNGIASKMALIEVIKYILGYKESSVINKRIVLDTEKWEIEKYDLV